MKPPAFQCYPKDYLTDENVLLMSLEEEGAYWRLMLTEWIEQSLPDNLEILAKICRISSKKMGKFWEKLGKCFIKRSDGRLVHPRLQIEREKQEANKANKTKAAVARWQPETDARALQMHCRCIAEPMQTVPSLQSSSSAIAITTSIASAELPRGDGPVYVPEHQNLPYPSTWVDHWSIQEWWETFCYRGQQSDTRVRETVDMPLHWQTRLAGEVVDRELWRRALEFWDGNNYKVQSVEKLLRRYHELEAEVLKDAKPVKACDRGMTAAQLEALWNEGNVH